MGFMVVALPAPSASLMLTVPLVGAGALFTSNDVPSSLCTLMTAHLMAFAVFLAVWTGLRPTYPASSRGSSHKWGNFKTSRQGLMVHYTEKCQGHRGPSGLGHVEVTD
jgi:hypothetical protein